MAPDHSTNLVSPIWKIGDNTVENQRLIEYLSKTWLALLALSQVQIILTKHFSAIKTYIKFCFSLTGASHVNRVWEDLLSVTLNWGRN